MFSSFYHFFQYYRRRCSDCGAYIPKYTGYISVGSFDRKCEKCMEK